VQTRGTRSVVLSELTLGALRAVGDASPISAKTMRHVSRASGDRPHSAQVRSSAIVLGSGMERSIPRGSCEMLQVGSAKRALAAEHALPPIPALAGHQRLECR
jgi:hypothetical protein